MRAQPLTDKTRPGGRPRRKRAQRNAFADWLAKCGKSPEQLAKALGVSISSIYNARNSYFTPGRDLAVKIEHESHGAVSVESWSKTKTRKRKA